MQTRRQKARPPAGKLANAIPRRPNHTRSGSHTYRRGTNTHRNTPERPGKAASGPQNTLFPAQPSNILIVTDQIGRPVGILDKFERGLERAVNGAFAKTFRSGVQPVELASALRRELDTKAVVVSRDRILVPNSFSIFVSAVDHERLRQIGPTLVDELISVVQQHATKQQYQFAGGISIRLAEDAQLTEGMSRIDSVNVKGTVGWAPVVDIGTRRYPIVKSRTVIGRGSDADITVDDTGTSRKHVEILWDGTRAQLNDLGSTNGSQLDGERVSQAPLPPDSVITIGRTRIVFRVLPHASTTDQLTDHPVDEPSTDRPEPGTGGRGKPGDGFWGAP